jgi:hypothetical protein
MSGPAVAAAATATAIIAASRGGGTPTTAAVRSPVTALSSQAVVGLPVAEVARKAGVLWVTVPGGRPRAAWVLWRDDRTYVLTGPGEQDLPGLAGAAGCTVTARGGLTWRATVTRVEPASAEWAAVFPVLAAKRLNGHPDPATAVVLAVAPTELAG